MEEFEITINGKRRSQKTRGAGERAVYACACFANLAGAFAAATHGAILPAIGLLGLAVLSGRIALLG